MANSTIEWTDKVWNPVTGCNKVSPGCKYCYAETVANRFWGEREFTDVWTHPERLKEPLRWKKPVRVFVNSMSDLFHESVPFGFIDDVFAIMGLTPHHTYQILTKRPERAKEYFDSTSSLAWVEAALALFPDTPIQMTLIKHLEQEALNNVWLGVSVESQKYTARVDILRKIPARVRFVSCEPLLEKVSLRLGGIHQVIVGGESGPRARPFDLEWALDIKRQCKTAGVAFFMKQVGSVPMMLEDEWRFNQPTRVLKAANRKRVPSDYVPLLFSGKGGNIDEFPEALRVREFPRG
jgi:protein gp37